MRNLIALAALTALVLSCSGRKVEVEKGAPVDPDTVLASLQEDAIRQARIAIEQGEELSREGLFPEARIAFDRAVDLLLEMPGGVESSPEAKALYEDLVATIHEQEREYLAGLSETVVPEGELAAVDELTSEVSLLEAVEDLEAEDAEVEAAEADLPPAIEATYDIPIELNARVLSIIEMFQTQKREWFQEALDRSGHYMPLFHRVLDEEKLPRDLVYLAMVESAFKTRAVSRAGARGMWQFISGTGKLYGLRQDYWVDDRYDPEKATSAAARHLKDLYNEFGDWYLAMAAYNAGPRRIERAVKRSGSRDFWTLAQRRFLPRETRSYVPLILAATVIAKNPEAYGFAPPATLPLEYDLVELEHPIDLETAAQAAGASVDDLKLLNPELRHWVTPLDRESYGLKVPKGTSDLFAEKIAAIPEDERVRFGAHVVERGETLSRIARRYGTSVDALASANRLSARSIIHPGQVLTVPVPPGAAARGAFFSGSRDTVPEGNREVYVVVRGDTLGAIAQSFGMSVDRLRRMNDIPEGSSRIDPGQRLVVAGSASTPRSAPAPTSISPTGGNVYVVRSGDTLGAIADAHRISLSQLRELNGMSRRTTRIYPGQKLLVSEGAQVLVASAEPAAGASGPSGTTSYRIRRGDTLSTIARRFGVSVDELRRWNGIDSDHIAVGQLLTIVTAQGSQ
jgi:membrane-bound lytic murein transglycosylase D